MSETQENVAVPRPKAHVINLKHRTDRWTDMNELFGNTFELERFEALEGKPSGLYCALSKIALIKKAKEESLPYLIMMEDDNWVSDKRFFELWPKIWKWLNANLDSWDLVNFNPTFMQNPKKVVSFDPLLIEFGYGRSGNFIIFNQTTYDKVISLEPLYLKAKESCNFPYTRIASDHMIGALGFKILTTFPIMTGQKPDYSDIQLRKVDYTHVFQMSNAILLNFLKANYKVVEKSESDTNQESK